MGSLLRAGTAVPISCGSSVQPVGHPTLLTLLSFCFGSAYCGGLWLAAVCTMCKMADVLGDAEVRQKYTDILSKGKEAFERMLWNGGCSPVGSHARLAVCLSLGRGTAPPWVTEPYRGRAKERRCHPSTQKGRSKYQGGNRKSMVVWERK